MCGCEAHWDADAHCTCDCPTEWHNPDPDPEAPADAALVGGEWCREETCRYRHWRSGSMPTHRRGADCPDPSPVGGEAAVEYGIENGWLVEVTNEHTCGAGPGSGYGCEPGCGLVPVAEISKALAAHDAAVRASALRDAADAMDDTDDPDAIYVDNGDIDLWLRARAARIARAAEGER